MKRAFLFFVVSLLFLLITTSTTLSQVTITSPTSGSVINDHSVLVIGQLDITPGTEVGVNVNDNVALRHGDQFAALVPVDEQTTSLTATARNPAGTVLGSHSIPVTVQLPTTEAVLFFRPSPAIALVSQLVSFTLNSLNLISQIELDANGDGTIDFTGTTLEGQTFSFTLPGIYFPTVRVTEPGGDVQTATAVIQVLEMNQLETLLQSKWNGMKDALRSGNTAAAASYVVASKQAFYQNMFDNLIVSFALIDEYLTNITFVEQRGLNIEYEMIRAEGLDQASYMVLFVVDEDGIWRIKFF